MHTQHLVGIDDLSLTEIETIFQFAKEFREQKKQEYFLHLQGKTLVNLFFEHSTRTLVSFEIAAKNLGAHVVNVNIAESSLNKGETILDMVCNIDAMGPDFLVIRHKDSESMNSITPHISAQLINAGNGVGEHPTQALLDIFTIKQYFPILTGLNIVICGDILHSRVAHSNILLLQKLGANIRLVGPANLLPDKTDLPKFLNIEEALIDADVIMALRVQLERMNKELAPSATEYFQLYGLTHERLKIAKPHAIVMHPGPVNRQVEMSSALVSDKKHNVILEQVRNGVLIRQAVLRYLNH